MRESPPPVLRSTLRPTLRRALLRCFCLGLPVAGTLACGHIGIDFASDSGVGLDLGGAPPSEGKDGAGTGGAASTTGGGSTGDGSTGGGSIESGGSSGQGTFGASSGGAASGGWNSGGWDGGGGRRGQGGWGGDWNSGGWNSGGWNSGGWNSGGWGSDWRSGSGSTGSLTAGTGGQSETGGTSGLVETGGTSGLVETGGSGGSNATASCSSPGQEHISFDTGASFASAASISVWTIDRDPGTSNSGDGSWTDQVGFASPGALEFIVRDPWDPTARQVLSPRTLPAAGDLTDRVIVAHVFVERGAGATGLVYAQSGDYVWANGPELPLPVGEWVCLSLDLAAPEFDEDGFDPANLVGLGIEIERQTTSALTDDIIVYLDDFSY